MTKKNIYTVLIFIFVISYTFSFNWFGHKDHDILKKVQIESLDLSGDINIEKEKGTRVVCIVENGSLDFNIDFQHSEKSVLWMYAKILDADSKEFYINQQKVKLSDCYDYGWIKINEIAAYEQIDISISNQKGDFKIDQFYFAKPGIVPFHGVDAFNDLKADVADGKVKIIFTGQTLTNADVELYRMMTQEAYIQYLKDKYRRISQSRIGILLSQFLSKSFKKVDTKRILNKDDYFLMDDKPLAKYECNYYLIVKNDFGQSLRSKKIKVDFDKQTQSVTQSNHAKMIEKTAAFKKESNYLKLQLGELKTTGEDKKIYYNSRERFNSLPDFLQNSYYFKSVQQAENIKYDFNKTTDVFVYLTSLDEYNQKYYFSKGFQLIKYPEAMTDIGNTSESYLFHKTYRPETGDSLFIKNNLKINNEESPFSIAVDGDDLVIYYYSKNRILEKYNHINIKGKGKRKNNFSKRMTQINDHLWEYRIKNGAVRYQNDQLNFSFCDENEQDIDYHADWIWDFYQYFKNRKSECANIVFFKERSETNMDIDFTRLYQSENKGLESYLLDNGEVFSEKSNGFSYGFQTQLDTKENHFFHKDNVTGFYNNEKLQINFASYHSELLNSSQISIIYSFDNWLSDNIATMTKNRTNRWTTSLDTIIGQEKISFYFTNDQGYIENNDSANWNWDYSISQVFGSSYPVNIIKKQSVELLPDSENNWKISLDNGIYQLKVFAQIGNTVSEDDNIAVKNPRLAINGKTYVLEKNIDELFELRDKIVIVNNELKLINTGSHSTKLFGLSLTKDISLIQDIVLPEKVEKPSLFGNDEITDSVIETENEEVINLTFDLTDVNFKDNMKLVFNASSYYNDYLVISSTNNFSDDQMISKIKLTNDISSYQVDLASYSEELIDNNQLKICLKLAKGTRLFNKNQEAAPIELHCSKAITAGIPYQNFGKLSLDGSQYRFTEINNTESFISISDQYNLADYLAAGIMVSGYINNDILTILKIEPVVSITGIEGDTYTNQEVLSWKVLTDSPADSLQYRIDGVVDWTEVYEDTIYQQIPEDGRYLLEILPIRFGLAGIAYSMEFIVDRTGPQIVVTENIPEYTANNTFMMGFEYSDNFSSDEEITFYYQLNDEAEIEFQLTDKQYELMLEEGVLDIEVYAKDTLGNIGNVHIINTTIDFTPPKLSLDVVNTHFKDRPVTERIILSTFIKEDNLTPDENLKVYYEINHTNQWIDTTADSIDFSCDQFEDGEYELAAYTIDQGGLISPTVTSTFVVDTIPIEVPGFYNTDVTADFLHMTWEDRREDPTFAYYSIRRVPDFNVEDEITNDHSIKVNTNEFTDIYALFNPEFKYYLKVMDIYGNSSEELYISPFNPVTVTGEVGESKTITFEDSTFTFTLENEEEKEIGVIKNKMDIHEHVQGDYNFIKNKIYELGPDEIYFETPALFSIDLSDIETSHIAKEDLVLYYFNRKANQWEEIDSKYNSDTDKLDAKIYHFSTYGVGTKDNSFEGMPNISTNVTPANGALNTNLELTNIVSSYGGMNLNLLFNSNSFGNIAKSIMSKDQLDNECKTSIEYDINLTSKAVDIIKDKIHSLQQRDENEKYKVFTSINTKDKILQEDNEDVLMDYIKNAVVFNHIDNIWNISLPELIKDDPKSKEFKYLKFEDGGTYQLGNLYNYQNTHGKKFIFRKINNGFLVRTENNKNYKFNNKGKIEYIFYTNDPDSIVNNIPSNLDKVAFSFNYANGNLLEINGHDKLGAIVSKLTFEYENLDNQYRTEIAKLNTDIEQNGIAKRITKIILSNINESNQERKLSEIYFNYQFINISPDFSGNQSYLTTYNNNANKKIVINYKYLESITMKQFSSGDNNENQLGEDTKYKVNYSFSDQNPVSVIDHNHKDFPYQDKTEKICVPIFRKRNVTIKYYYYRNEELKLPILFDNVKLIGNHKLKKLEKISIEKEEDFIKDFLFENTTRVNEWNIFSSHNITHCTERNHRLLNNENIPIESSKLTNFYFYKENSEMGLMPFMNCLKVTKKRIFELNSLNEADINSRNIDVDLNESNNEFYFEEFKNHRIYGILEKKSGYFKKDSFAIEDFKSDYLSNETVNHLENITDSLAYYKDEFIFNGNNQLLQNKKTIKTIDGLDEKIIAINENTFDDDKLKSNSTYINSNTKKTVTFDFDSTFSYLDSEESFLVTLPSESSEQISDNVDKISKSNYTRLDNGNIAVQQTAVYLSDNNNNKQISEYEYYENGTIKKEVDVVRDTDQWGLKGKTTEFFYDRLNKMTSKNVSGVSNIVNNNSIDKGQKTIISKKYYDPYTHLLLAEEKYEETENKVAALYFYDDERRCYKKVKLSLENGIFNNTVLSSFSFKDEYFTGSLKIKGILNQIESSAAYENYYTEYIINGNETANIQYSQYLNYQNNLETLKTNNFDLSNKCLEYFEASLIFYFDQYDLLKESYKVDIEADMSTGKVLKRYEIYSIDNQGNIITQYLDTKDEQGEWLKYSKNYDVLNNLTSESYPDPEIPVIYVETDYYDYYKIVTEKQDNLNNEKHIPYSGEVTYEKMWTADNKYLNEIYYNYNLANQLISKVYNDGITEKYSYNLYGLKSSTIENPIKGSPVKYTSRHVYNKYGKSINEYSDIQINSSSFNPDNWISQSEYDDFGLVIKTTNKQDSEILDDSVTPFNSVVQTAYNIYGKPVFETSNRFEHNANSNDDLLGNTVYQYNSNSNVTQKKYYSWNPQNTSLILITENYAYDDLGRLIQSDKIMDNNGNVTILNKSIIKDFDVHNKPVLTYSKERDKNWVEITESYNQDGNLLYTLVNVTDKGTDIFEEPNSYILTQGKYLKYDNYQKKIAEVDLDRNNYLYEYQNGRVVKEYSGVNFKYTINSDHAIVNLELGQPKEISYDQAGNVIKEILSDGSQILREKYYQYDPYGRKIAESSNRYEHDTPDMVYYTYDGIGRLETTIDGEMKQTVTQWETDNQPKIINYQLSNGSTTLTYNNTIYYSMAGNEVEIIDRDGYHFIQKFDNYHNMIEYQKKLDSTIIQQINNTYDSTGLFLTESSTSSQLASVSDTLKTVNIYDFEGRLTGEESYTNSELTNSKSYLYNDKGQLERLTLTTDGNDYHLQYRYNSAGLLNQKIYPNGKIETINFSNSSEPVADGRIKSIEYDGGYLLNNFNYQFEHSNIFRSYMTGDGYRTTFNVDAANRNSGIVYENIGNGQGLLQDYQYDKAGNITQITESDYGAELLKNKFNRDFTYDKNNRLINAIYSGEFSHELKPKLTYQDQDYQPDFNYLSIDSLTDDTEMDVNIESKSPSILISDPLNSGREITPEIIRIYKGSQSQLKENMINMFYQDDLGTHFLKNCTYTTEDNDQYFELDNFNDIDLAKIIKLNFDLDNRDIDNNPIINHTLDEKLRNVIRFYSVTNGIELEYAYDILGNRVYEKQQLYKDADQPLNSQEKQYQYSDDKRLLREDDNYIYEYNLNGSLIKKTSKNSASVADIYWIYKWDPSGNLTGTSKYKNTVEDYTEQYYYDSQGKRIKKVTPDETVIYIYEGVNLIYEKTIDTETTNVIEKNFIYSTGSLQAAFTYENGASAAVTTNYYHNDVLGSTRFITNASGVIIQEDIFKPFGQRLIGNEQSQDNRLHYLFASHDPINEKTGLQYMQARWMDNTVGRFISSDPAKDGLNYYTYCDNNPTSLIDP
ncbi:MAG: hypothetical protein MJB14_18970, partial [Spirochaetes bacterium]|nr:hypothetical protein [Spirochaetota bacterium]